MRSLLQSLKHPAIVLALLVVPAAEARAQPTFVDVTPAAVAVSATSVAWGDYDRDGDLDLFFSRSPNKLYRNDAGSFVDVTANPIAIDDGIATLQGAWGDYDGDGNLDLVQAKVSTTNRLFRNQGDGTFVETTHGPLAVTGFWWGMGWADYDIDGDLDLFITQSNGANRLMRNDSGTVVDATTAPLAGGASSGVAWADYDDDGDPDLYFANNTSASKLLRNDSGTFVDVTTGPLGGLGSGRGATWGDYDNDGDLDLFLTHQSHANKLLRKDGGGTFVDATPPAIAGVWNSRGAAWGDYDNDRDLDLYVSNNGAPNSLYRNDGGGVFADATNAPLNDGGGGQGVAWADYDGDGDLDLCLTNVSPSSRLFRNDNANGNHWLEVRAQGVASNRWGIGARVVLVAGGVTQIREITAGSGYLAQEPPIAHFGLGSTTTITSLEVHWPNGNVTTVPTPVADQATLAVEPGALAIGDGTHEAASIELTAPSPNPFGAHTRIAYSLPHAAEVRITVHDLRGGEVAELFAGQRNAGSHTAIWTGRGSGGQRLGAGVYFARLTVTHANGTETRVRKLALVR